MLDLIPHEAPYTYYMQGFVTPTQLADDKNIEIPLISFKDFLTEYLPRRLQILISRSELFPVFVFAIDYKPSQDEAKDSSEECRKSATNRLQDQPRWP
jgi:hypothetical protein